MSEHVGGLQPAASPPRIAVRADEGLRRRGQDRGAPRTFRAAGPTFYAVTGTTGDQCFEVTHIGTGKDGETASSGLAHAWVATDTGTPGWCISAKAGEWLIAKSAGDACPPA